MAGLDELPVWLRTTLTLYPRRGVDPVRCSPMRKPIARTA